jgi:hypothetical protein
VALGAEPPAILRMVVGHGLKLVALGLNRSFRKAAESNISGNRQERVLSPKGAMNALTSENCRDHG